MQNVKSHKKDLSAEQRKELLRALKARFEQNMNGHASLEWAKVQAKLEANPEKLRSLSEMERTGGELANTFFVIVLPRVPKAAEVFATTVKRWSHGKKINQKIALWIWPLPWASSF